MYDRRALTYIIPRTNTEQGARRVVGTSIMSGPYRATTIANELIRLATAEGRGLTPMQLVKLTYIAHGWSLALLGRPLIGDHVEAWKYGPVIPSLYQYVKQYGSAPVTSPIPVTLFSRAQSLDATDEALVRDVYAKYGKLTGIQLSHLTHKPGTPWFNVFDPDGWGIQIPNELIQRHYQELAQAA